MAVSPAGTDGIELQRRTTPSSNAVRSSQNKEDLKIRPAVDTLLKECVKREIEAGQQFMMKSDKVDKQIKKVWDKRIGKDQGESEDGDSSSSDSDGDSDSVYFDALDDNDQIREERRKAVPLREKLENIQGLVIDKPSRKNFKKNMEDPVKFLRHQQQVQIPSRWGLWNSAIWRVRAKHGPTVASCFKFIRWIFFLNVINSILTFSLVSIPQFAQVANDDENRSTCQRPVNHLNMTYCDSKGTVVDTVKDTDGKMVNVTAYNISMVSDCCSESYSMNAPDLPPISFEGADAGQKAESFFNSLIDWITMLSTGSGWIERQALFYGYYSGTFVFEIIHGVVFDFPLAYFLVMVSVLLFNVVTVTLAAATAFKVDGDAQTDELADYRTAEFVFSCWDHRTVTKKTAENFKLDIKNQIERDLKTFEDEKEVLSTNEKRWRLLRRICAWIVTAAFLGCFGVLIYQLFTTWVQKWTIYLNCGDTSGNATTLNTIECSLVEFAPSIAITFFNMTLPVVFSFMLPYEGYKSNAALTIHLARCIILRLASLVVTAAAIIQTVSCDYYTDASHHQVCQNDLLYRDDSFSNKLKESQNCDKGQCWETYVGQQFYKLTVIDFAAILVQIFVAQVIRVFVFGKCLGWKSPLTTATFDVAQSGLAMIYSQAICWLGIYFCPLITVVTAIKTFVVFYVQRFYVSKVCSIPEKVPYTASRASAIFNCLLLVSFGFCAGIVVYCVSEVGPSPSCGPFRNVGCQNEPTYIYFRDVLQDKATFLWNILTFVGTQTIQYGLFGGLLLWLYILASNNFAQSGLLVEQKKDWRALKQKNSEKWAALNEAVRQAFASPAHLSSTQLQEVRLRSSRSSIARHHDAVTTVNEIDN